MRDIIVWNIIAIICLSLPAYMFLRACVELLIYVPEMDVLVLGLILLTSVPFIVLIVNVVTLWGEDREEKKLEEFKT